MQRLLGTWRSDVEYETDVATPFLALALYLSAQAVNASVGLGAATITVAATANTILHGDSLSVPSATASHWNSSNNSIQSSSFRVCRQRACNP